MAGENKLNAGSKRKPIPVTIVNNDAIGVNLKSDNAEKRPKSYGSLYINSDELPKGWNPEHDKHYDIVIKVRCIGIESREYDDNKVCYNFRIEKLNPPKAQAADNKNRNLKKIF